MEPFVTINATLSLITGHREMVNRSATAITGTVGPNGLTLYFLNNTGTDLIISRLEFSYQEHYIIPANTYYLAIMDGQYDKTLEPPWVFYDQFDGETVPNPVTRTAYVNPALGDVTIKNLNVKAYYEN